MLRASNQNDIFIKKDLLARGWLEFEPDGSLNIEIDSALWANYVEEKIFKFSIIEKLDQSYEQRFTDFNYYKNNVEGK